MYIGSADGAEAVFHPAPLPRQEDVEAVVDHARRRILRFLERRGGIVVVATRGAGPSES